MTHDGGQFLVALNDHLQVLESVSQLVIFLDVILEDLLDLKPLLLLRLKEEFFAIKFLAELFDFDFETLLLIVSPGQSLLLDLLIQKYASAELFTVFL